MKSLFRWASMIWLPASVVLAQGPTTAEVPRPDWPKSAVTVVFAPDYGQALRPPQPDRHSQVDPSGNSRRLDTASRILNAMTNGRVSGAANPVEFTAPGGLIGIRPGVESTMATSVTIGDGGKLQFQCARLPEALERLKAASSAARPLRKEIANDK